MAATATDPVKPEHSITTLDSGVRIVTERIPGVRSVALGFFVANGSVDESDEQAGISHLLEHMLFRGTARFGSQEIDQIFDGMGAEINAGTDKESTSLYTRVLDRHLQRAFEVMSDMIWHPVFGELEAEREVVLEEIAMYEDDPQDRVFDVLGRAIFGRHPLGRPVIGSAASVRAVTREQLADFHAERYRPECVVIAAAGSIDHDALVGLARTIDEAREPRPSANGAATWRDGASTPEFQPRVDFFEKDTEQYHVCLGGAGIARHDERRFALRVLEGILGGTSSSRLFQEVRERRGLAYSVFSYSNLYAHTGDVGMYLGTRGENLAEALEVVADELARFAGADGYSITEEELTRSRENLKGRMVLAMESTGARMARLGSALLGEMPILSVNEMIDRIDAVTHDDLCELASSLFAPERLAAAGVGPAEERFRAALAPLGGSFAQEVAS